MKRFFLLIAALSLFAACSKEREASLLLPETPLQNIKVNVASFEDINSTKTAVTPTGAFTWSAGDQIGIYPLSTGEAQTSQQIIFKVESGADAASSTFTGTGWGLITNGEYSYFSYYPYSASTSYDEAVVTFSNELNQESNTSTAHLGVNDYLYAPAITPTSATSAQLNFYHLSALLELEITVPESVKTKNFKKVSLSASEPVFTLSGKYNPSITTTGTKPSITDNVYTDKLVLKLNNSEGFAPDVNGKIHAFFLIAPAAVSGKTLSVSIIDSDNRAYIASKVPSQDIQSQNHVICQYTVALKPTTTAENLSATGTANCYIAPEYGRYKFLANVRGNGYDPFDSESHIAGAAINLTGLDADVLWETSNTNSAPSEGAIVQNVELEENYICFTATGAPGNAVISLKDGSNNIVWSWQIWSTDVDLESKAQEYGGQTMMDRNLGATSIYNCGLAYQYGRPWPFADNSKIKTTNASIWESIARTSDVGTIEYSDAHPTTFIYTGDHWKSWFVFTNPGLWSDTKTMYDPCPIGWKLASIGIVSKTPFNNETVKYDAEADMMKLSIGSVEAYFPTGIGATGNGAGIASSTDYYAFSSTSALIISRYHGTYSIGSGGVMACPVRPCHE